MSPVEILVAATTVSIAAALPISIAGVGVREANLPLLLAADGVSRELAITLGMAFWDRIGRRTLGWSDSFFGTTSRGS